MVKHDENKDLKSLSRIAKINLADKTIQCAKSTTIGIHMWGKIDFLTHYCGWHFIWNNNAGNSYAQFNSNSDVDVQKKSKKEHQLTDKTKKSKKK